MPILIIAILAVVQGITEFLPISSSGHLILTWRGLESVGYTAGLTGAEELALDVAVHVGALLAVLVYLHRELWQMLKGGLALLAGRVTGGGRLGLQVVAATLPVVVAGFLLKDFIAEGLRDPRIIAWTTIVFGIALYFCDRWGGLTRRIEGMATSHALIIGVSQILALIPGTSRSGITMTAARALGFARTEAARFSLLLSIPAILGAGTLLGADVYRAGNLALGLDALIAIALSFVTALVAIAVMMRWLKHFSFTPFVIYRILLGVGLLLVL